MRKKIYISLPISDRDLEEVKKRAEYLKGQVDKDLYEAITPFDVCPDETLPYRELMGRDIAALMECDGVLFDYDWRESKGCRLEHAVAEIYNIRIYQVKDERVCADDDSQRFTMELSKKQLRILNDMCECQARNICGQLDVGLETIIYRAVERTYPTAEFQKRHEICEDIAMRLKEIKKLGWDMEGNASYGIKYDDLSDILFDFHQVIRHHLWLVRPEPKCDFTNDAYPATQHGSEPLVTILTLPENGKQ